GRSDNASLDAECLQSLSIARFLIMPDRCIQFGSAAYTARVRPPRSVTSLQIVPTSRTPTRPPCPVDRKSGLVGTAVRGFVRCRASGVMLGIVWVAGCVRWGWGCRDCPIFRLAETAEGRSDNASLDAECLQSLSIARFLIMPDRCI